VTSVAWLQLCIPLYNTCFGKTLILALMYLVVLRSQFLRSEEAKAWGISAVDV